MESAQTTSKSTKIKLDFKDSKYATGRRKARRSFQFSKR